MDTIKRIRTVNSIKCKISVLNIPGGEGLYATKCCNKESCGGMDNNMYDVAVVCFYGVSGKRKYKSCKCCYRRQ